MFDVGGGTLSQGRKSRSEPSLFIPTNEVYGHIPKTHFYERLGEVLDLRFVHELTKPLYAEKLGRPSLDPVVFFKCMLVGFFENMVYDTELEYRIADSLTVRKFLGYELNERTPDESTLRKTRQRMPEEVFKAVFDYVLEACQRQGLLKGRAIGTDSTPIDANASMDSLRHKELGCTYGGVRAGAEAAGRCWCEQGRGGGSGQGSGGESKQCGLGERDGPGVSGGASS